ncbi:MAG: VanZ family protein [Clostridia bacterium]|nr:VanZ family protein [Clostridia bacterium]
MTRKVILLILIFLNLSTIFFFSHQSAEKSGALSDGLSHQIEIRTPDYETKNQVEKNMLHVTWRKQVRRLAHVALFLSLGVLVSLFLWDGSFSWGRTAGGILFGVLCSFGDEIHQLFVPGRTFQWHDIGNDILGYFSGMVLCGLVFGMLSFRKWRFSKKAK